MIFKKAVEVEVTGDVDDVHPVDEELTDGHHLDQRYGELGARVHTGVVEDKPGSVNAGPSVLIIDESCGIQDGVKYSQQKTDESEAFSFENCCDALSDAHSYKQKPRGIATYYF